MITSVKRIPEMASRRLPSARLAAEFFRWTAFPNRWIISLLMNKLSYRFLTAQVLVALSLQAQTNSWLVNSFETGSDLAVISQNNTTVSLSTNGVTVGQHSGCVTFSPSAWPNVYFKSGVAFTNLDWHSRGGLAVDILNTNAVPISVYIRVDDDFSANGVVHCQTASLNFPANTSGTFVMAFPQSAVTNMRADPPLVASNALSGSVYGPALNWSNIVAFQIFLAGPTNPTTLYLDNLRLLPVPNLNGIVDAYGQYAGADWPGKIHQDSDFANQNSQEQQWLAAHPKPTDRDIYGAWSAGPQLNASGWFRTAWVVGTNEVVPGSTNRGRWWLVAPSGRRFLSVGIDVIDYGETTAVTGRENMFSLLPAAGDPLAQFSTPGANRTANFYGMNLDRKFGSNWMSLARSRVYDRLDAWGFNSIGNWSSADLYSGHRTPYTVPIWYDWTPLATFTSAAQKMVDPFDPAFPAQVDAAIASETAAWKNDPWCLGYFVDNELPWGGWSSTTNDHYALPVGVLAFGGSLPAKSEFARQMQLKYPTITGLNTAWNTSIATWSAFSNQVVTLPSSWTAACVTDMSAFLTNFAGRYFSVVNAKLKQHAPSQLYLGSRFASHPIEAVTTAAQSCDVVTFNIYRRSLDTNLWTFTRTLGKPCLVGEYHFGALDRGMFSPGLVQASNQADRGQAYQEYVRSVLSLPAFVGCQWFQYYDEPLLGRFDGENYNIGFVSGADTPYWELIAAAQQINAKIYTLFASPTTVSVATGTNTMVLNWPFLPVDAVLESTASLSSTSTWSQVTVPASLIGAEKVATLPTKEPERFFRLRLP